MVIGINLKNLVSRSLVLILSLVVLGFLTRVVVAEFIAGTIIDSRRDPTPKEMFSATRYIPNSARLFARLAEAEANGPERNLESAERDAQQAISLSPNNYNYRLLLASIREARGDSPGAEQSMEDALRLAPHYAEVHWKMANLQLRMGHLETAIEHLHFVAKENPQLVPAALDLVWSYSNQNVASLRRLADGNPQAQLSVARFLANKSRLPDAIAIFSAVDRDVTVKSSDFSPFIDLLIKNGYPGAANTLFARTIASTGNAANIWNGDFEREMLPGQPLQFGWRLKDSVYAKARIDNKTARSGGRSLEIDFAGKDTTRLTDEIQHLVVLEPGVTYRIECFVKTKQFQTPEGPRIVVSDKSGKAIAQSEAVSSGNNDWTPLAVAFAAPNKSTDDAATVNLFIKREPHFAYDEPTKGQIWFDDFVISRVGGK